MSLRAVSVLVSAAFCVLYVGAGIGLGEQFPFSPLHMFARGGTSMARIVVRGADGMYDVEDFARWRCDTTEDLALAQGRACGVTGSHPERDRIMADYIAGHPAAPGEGVPVTLVRRVFRIERPGAPVVTTDCDLARCAAVPVRP